MGSFLRHFSIWLLLLFFTLPHHLISRGELLDLDDVAKKYLLTKRELELLPYIIQGQSNQEIADELHISLYRKAACSSFLLKLMSKTDLNYRVF